MSSKSFMRKTRSFMRFNALRNIVSDSMAIDMGSANTIINVRGRGVVVDEPSIVAIDKVSGEVLAVGREAQQMLGREARDVAVIAPMVDGVVADFERTQAMLDRFVREARSGISHFSRRAVMSVLSGVTQVEQRALLSAAEHAHIGRVYMVEEGLAAAIGAGVSIDDNHASAVVDIGGSTTNMDLLRRYRGLSVGAATAERLKIELGSAIESQDAGRKVSVRGSDVQTGSPGAVDVTAADVYGVVQNVIRKIADEVRETLAELQPEVAADIYDRGLILTGGGALLENLQTYLERETKLQVRIADEPRFSIVRGLMQLFDEPLLLRRVARNEQHPLIDAQA